MKITRDSNVYEVLEKYPDTFAVGDTRRTTYINSTLSGKHPGNTIEDR